MFMVMVMVMGDLESIYFYTFLIVILAELET